MSLYLLGFYVYGARPEGLNLPIALGIYFVLIGFLININKLSLLLTLIITIMIATSCIAILQINQNTNFPRDINIFSEVGITVAAIYLLVPFTTLSLFAYYINKITKRLLSKLIPTRRY